MPFFPDYKGDDVWRALSKTGEPMPRIGTGGKAELIGAVLDFNAPLNRLICQMFFDPRYLRWGWNVWRDINPLGKGSQRIV